MDTSTLPLMPMPSAVKGALPMGAPSLPPTPLPLPPMPGAPPQAGPLPMGAPQAPAGPLPMPPGNVPLPPVPQKPPYDVRMQPDGTAVYFTTAPDGNEVIIGLNPPPKLPKALQPAAPKQ